MRYSRNYIQSHDIDWFFLFQYKDIEIPIHIASRGNALPEFVNDLHGNRLIQHKVSILDDEYEGKAILGNIQINESAVSEIVEITRNAIRNYNLEGIEYSPEIFRQTYLETFAYMAHAGFYSFDIFPEEKEEDKYESPYYRLIAKPTTPGILPADILKLLPTDRDFSNYFLHSIQDKAISDLHFLIDRIR